VIPRGIAVGIEVRRQRSQFNPSEVRINNRLLADPLDTERLVNPGIDGKKGQRKRSTKYGWNCTEEAVVAVYHII